MLTLDESNEDLRMFVDELKAQEDAYENLKVKLLLDGYNPQETRVLAYLQHHGKARRSTLLNVAGSGLEPINMRQLYVITSNLRKRGNNVRIEGAHYVIGKQNES